ncbi:MAG: pectate lyase [Bacteroidales bacterium]|nr:pectate lyase [Bacteroidales bacterium]
MRFFLVTIVACIILSFPVCSQPLAFPGAEGFGAMTLGGRGGAVLFVNNLNDSGPGSLRDAVEQEGPRTIVFGISGTIELESDLYIRNPYLTIAGQTAPGDGITLKNYKITLAADHVIIRYLRVRRGNLSEKQDDAITIQNAENVIVDHCSFSWSTDEVVNTWHGSKNISLQWCIMAEGLHHKEHGFAATLGGINATYHHNLIANCPGRNPSIGGNHNFQTHQMDFRNNVIFNFGHRTFDGKPSSVNIVNNYFKPGPNSTIDVFARIDEAGIYEEIPTTSWFISGNFWEGNEAISKNNRLGVKGATQWLVDQPTEFSAINMESAEAAYRSVLAGAGARFPKRDCVDLRILEEARTGKTTYNKGVVLSTSDVEGWPLLNSLPAPVDSDSDGMPDEWEIKHGLDSANPEDRNTTNAEGYTMLEQYLNELVQSDF